MYSQSGMETQAKKWFSYKKANHKKRSSVFIIDFQQLLNSFMTEAVII